MPQSNRIILTDVDGVLLEWENHFIQWMLKRSHFVRGKRRQTYKLLPNKEREYAMEKSFGITPTTIQKEIREFNRSAWMATQPPLPEAVTYVKLLHAEGWTFIPITSQTSDVPAQMLRKRRLAELFGEHTFQNYFILETGDNKGAALSEFKNTNLCWVEDKYQNCLTGLKLGLRPILINHEYNQQYSHPKVRRVNNWREIHQILSGRKK